MSHQYQPSGSGSGDPYGYGSADAGGYSGAPTSSSDPYSYQPAGAGYDSSAYGSDPYGNAGYGNAGYGAPKSYSQPGYVQAPPQNTLALLSLIMSLVGLATGGLTSIAGIILGHMAKSQIKRTGESGDSLATWGLISGYVIVGLIALFWLAYILFFVLAIGATMMGAS